MLSIGYIKKSARWKADAPAARLIEAARRGAPQKSACEYAGISPRTFQLWRTAWSGLDLDAEHTRNDALLVRLFHLYDDAAASLKVELIGSWADAAKTDWRASQAFLSRRDPEHFGDPKTRLELTGAEGGPVAVASPAGPSKAKRGTGERTGSEPPRGSLSTLSDWTKQCEVLASGTCALT